MSEKDEASKDGGQGESGGFSSVRSMWQEKAKVVHGTPAPTRLSGRPFGGRTSAGSGNAPPQSPSSRANVLLSKPQDTTSDVFQQYGIVFVDNSGILCIRKVIPGSVADQAGVIFPGDRLYEVNGMEVYKWPIDRVTPLASGDRAGSTLRLAFERVGFTELINVELELGKNHPRPSPRLSPQSLASPPQVEAMEQPPSPGIQAKNSHDNDYEEYQPAAQMPAFDDPKDEMRVTVVKRYKARIQELSQNLEETQVSAANQARQVEEMARFLNEKDDLLKELREAVSKLTNRLEESSRENLELRRKSHAQVHTESSNKSPGGGNERHLTQEVQRLTTELAALNYERDIAQLAGRSSVDDVSDQLRELKLQMIEKDAKVQDLEGKIASLKRSNVIQAVELQELHDHVAGMEKQKIAMQVQQFPPLPPLQSVRESPYETPMDDDEKMKAILLADEVLQKAQEEIAVLKQRDERRLQLEMWTEQSQQEIHRLRKELADSKGAGDGAERSEILKRELDDLRLWSQNAKAESEGLQRQLLLSKSQADALTEQLAGLDALRAKNFELEKSKLLLEAQVQALLSNQHGPAGPSSGPDEPSSGEGVDCETFLDHPMMQAIGMLDQKQAELQQYVAKMPKSQVSNKDKDDGETAQKLVRRDELISWLKMQLKLVGDQLRKAREKFDHSEDDGAVMAPTEISAILQKVVVDIEATSKVQLEDLTESILVDQMDLLRAQLHGKDEALYKLTSSLEPDAKTTALQLVAETQKVQDLQSEVEELIRKEGLMVTEMDLTKEAYAKARGQYLAAEVEIKMLRSHLDNLKVDADSQAHQVTSARGAGEVPAEEHSARLFESMMQEKRGLEETLNKTRDEKNFIERCLTDARMDVSRLEAENESANNALHESQLMVAKMEGKLQAAQTGVTSLERELSKKKDELAAFNDEIKRTRQNMIQSDAEKGLENNTLRNELKLLRDENEQYKREVQEQMEQLAERHQQELSEREQQLQKITSELSEREQQLQKLASEKSGLSESFAVTESIITQKDHKLGVYADQLKVQKEKALQAEAAAQQVRDELNAEIHRNSSRDLRLSSLEERVLEMQAELSSKQVELQVAISQKEEALAAIEAQGVELEHKIEQTDALRAVIRRLQGEGAAGSDGVPGGHLSVPASSPQSWGAPSASGPSSSGGARPPLGVMPTPGSAPQQGPMVGGGFKTEALSSMINPNKQVALQQTHASHMPPQQNWHGTPKSSVPPRPGAGSPWITKTSIM